jgi:RHS repeat-associated protein
MTRMPHLPLMRWDYRDQFQATAQQVVNNGAPETTWYVYDSSGQRVRKVTDRQAAAGATPTRMKERIYLDGFEIYREYESDGNTVNLERETLHIMDDKQRVALVETRTQGNDGSPAQLNRFQFGNPLGSASLELDEQAQVICYEEYTPYGSTSYQAVRSQIETPKRYRFTGKERDEESGLYYHGARYYAVYLGRWLRPDPLYLNDASNLYIYALNNPIVAKDPTGGPVWLIPVAIYLGWRALESAAETGIEAGIAEATGDESFSVGETFVKNLAVNSVIGLIPGAAEAKIGTKAAIYGAKLAVRTSGDATLDTLQGKGSFEENLQKNAIANVGGDLGGALLKKGGKKLVNKLKGAPEQATEEVTEKLTKGASESLLKQGSKSGIIENVVKNSGPPLSIEEAELRGVARILHRQLEGELGKLDLKDIEVLEDLVESAQVRGPKALLTPNIPAEREKYFRELRKAVEKVAENKPEKEQNLLSLIGEEAQDILGELRRIRAAITDLRRDPPPRPYHGPWDID